MEKFDDDAGADDADDADTDDDDDVKKKLGVVEGAFALLCPHSRQTGSGDGSKEVLLLLLYCPVTKLFAHDRDDDDESLMVTMILRKCPLMLYWLVTKLFSNGGEDNDDISEGDYFRLERFRTIQRDTLSDSIHVQSFLKCCKFTLRLPALILQG